jgi:hypothetical protein
MPVPVSNHFLPRLHLRKSQELTAAFSYDLQRITYANIITLLSSFPLTVVGTRGKS